MTTPPDWVMHAYRQAAEMTAEAKRMHARQGNTPAALAAYRAAADATAAAHQLHLEGNTHD